MRLIGKALWIGLLLFTVSCHNSFSDVQSFEEHLKQPDSPLTISKIANGVKLQARWVPTDGMMLNDYRRLRQQEERLFRDSALTVIERDAMVRDLRQKLKKKRQGYRNSHYINLTISYEDEAKDVVYTSMQKGFGEYSQWLQKLLFGLNKMIYLQDKAGQKTELDTYHFERTYGMSKSRTLLLMFPSDPLQAPTSIDLVIEEFGLGIGQQRLTFTGLDELPQLQMQMLDKTAKM